MANIESLLERYKKELSAVTERCLKTEEDKELYYDLYNFVAKDAEKKGKAAADASEAAKQAEEYNTKLLSEMDLLKEWIEDHGGKPEDIIAGVDDGEV